MTREWLACLRMRKFPCARKRALAQWVAGSAALARTFFQGPLSTISVPGMVLGKVELRGALAARLHLAAPRRERMRWKRRKKSRNDGRGFSAARRWRG